MTTETNILTNLHPNWRALHLSSIRQTRQMLRDGRYTIDCMRIIKDTQRQAASIRAALAKAKAGA